MNKCAYVDSSIWIARIEGLPAYRKIIDEHWQEFIREDWRFFVLDAVFLEVLGKPLRENRFDKVSTYDKAFAPAYVLPLYDNLFRDALSLMRKEPLQAMDALHMAFALHHSCDRFITTDNHFKPISCIPILWIDLSSSV